MSEHEARRGETGRGFSKRFLVDLLYSFIHSFIRYDLFRFLLFRICFVSTSCISHPNYCMTHTILYCTVLYCTIRYSTERFKLVLLLLLLLLGLLFESPRNEFVRVHPLVDGRLDAGHLGPVQCLAGLGRDAFFVRLVGQIVDDLLDEHLLLEHHGHLLHLGSAAAIAASSGRHHVGAAAAAESGGIVGRERGFSAASAVLAASTEPAHNELECDCCCCCCCCTVQYKLQVVVVRE